jgi:Lipase (class 3)
VAHRTEQVMLTLAGLAYRGFHDLLAGAAHAHRVRYALLDGLRTLPPVEGEWALVWGPVTSRSGPDAFDSAAMFVVRHRREPARYVVAIRGTNPIAASDWLFGDFWVSTTVPWPYARAADRVAVSASTALGLSKLQAMRAPREPAEEADPAAPPPRRDALERQVEAIAASWARLAAEPSAWVQEHLMDRLRTAVTLPWMELRPRSPAPDPDGPERDLLSFLAAAARAQPEPLDVWVTGHSKGGALACATALWLEDTLASADPAEHWDGGRGARISCYAFAAPTPGNAAFASRVERVLGKRHHHLRNTNDVVTHAWQADELQRIPALYDPRRPVLEPLIPFIVSRVKALDYRHAQTGVDVFAGLLDPERPFVAEFVHQHLQAYLEHCGLARDGVTARALFF